MIVSHRHRFIFIHCRKVAGSSMKVALAPNLGGRDLMLGSLHEALRDVEPRQGWILRQLMTPGGLRELVDARRKNRDWRSALNKVVKKRAKRRLGLSSSSHPPAAEVRSVFPREWDRYFKFCFVRNPYERAVSDYLYRTRNESNPPAFREHLAELHREAEAGKTKHDNWPMYTIDDQVAMDFVGRFENLDADFREAMTRVGLKDVALASEKRRDYPRPWQDYFGADEKGLVERLYRCEIEYFGYGFDDSSAGGA